MEQGQNIELSIVIPTYNEEGNIAQLISHLKNSLVKLKTRTEILVVDGGSQDSTVELAKSKGAIVIPSKKGRAVQMNAGASSARGNLIYFLHADTYPPYGFDKKILAARQEGFKAGCFRLQFNTDNRFLRFFAWFSRLNHTLCRGGDQSLFIDRSTFQESGGFNEDYIIYEDSEFIKRLYKNLKFKVLPDYVTTSARLFKNKGPLKVMFHFGMIHLHGSLGSGPEKLYEYYQKNIVS